MALSWRITLCVFVIVLLGSASGLLTVSSIKGWYADLERPPGTPPNWIFGPMWTALYVMMGTALALVWHVAKPGREKRRALTSFGVQFALNLAWTPVFFGAHATGAALIVILALVVAIVITIFQFRLHHALAAALLVPYLLWVCYATYLNAGFWWLNR